jgi:PAS domain S-box-containing protein
MTKTDMHSPALAAHPALLEAITRCSQDAIITITSRGTLLSWNPAAVAMFGYPEYEMRDLDISLLLPGLSIDKQVGMLSCSNEMPVRIAYVSKRKDGTSFDVNITVSPIETNAYDNIFLFIIKDISAIQQAIGNAAHLKAIFDNAEEGFVLIGRDYNIKTFNAKACESIVLSYSDTEVKEGQSILQYIEEVRRPFFIEMVNAVLAGESMWYDRSYTAADGKITWYNFSLKPVYEGSVVAGVSITGKDITKRKMAEQRAEQNEKRFRGMVENSGDAVSILSEKGNPQYISPSIRKILGYSEEEAMNMNLFSLIHPDDQSIVQKMWRKILDSPGIPFHGNVCRLKHANGSWRWIDGTINNMLNDPSIGGIVDNFRDITDSIESARKLRMSEERYRYLFYNNPLPMWIYEPESLNFLEVNNAAIEKYGYTRKEFLQLNLRDIRCMEDEEKLLQAVKDRKKKIYNMGGVWEHLTKQKELLHVEISSHPVHYEGVNAVLVLAHDVTEKIKATQLLLKAYDEKTNILEKLRRANERYSLVTKATQDLVWDWDLVTGVVYRDEQAVRDVYGCCNEKIINIEDWNKRIHPDDAFRVSAMISEIKQSVSRDFFDIEYQFLAESGDYKYIYDRGYIVRNHAGQPIRIIGAANDITEKRKLQKTLQEERQRQQRFIAEATIRGQENERAQLGTELHDNINQILATSSLYLDSALSGDIKDARVIKSKDLITMAIRELRKLSHTLLPPSLHEFGLKAALHELTDIITETGFLVFDRQWNVFEEELIDRDQQLTVYRIVQEQINNIIKHAAASNVRISLRLVSNSSGIELSVRDNGKGFDPRQKRNGVGLRNITSRAELYYGHVIINSKPGQGCELKVIFPVMNTCYRQQVS